MPLDALHDAGGVLAIVKPAGLPTQAAAGLASAEWLVRKQLFGDRAAADRAAGRSRHPGGFLGVPHRLDRGVSGVLLLATTPRAARQLSRQFERRQIRKTYLAIAAPTSDALPDLGAAFEWRDTIRKLPDEPRGEIVPPATAGGREAVTTGSVKAVAENGMLLLELQPLTGRMHQLRLQAAARGMPIIGDTLYGGPAVDPLPPSGRSATIGLHAFRIAFIDPARGTGVTVTCPLPPTAPWLAVPGGPPPR